MKLPEQYAVVVFHPVTRQPGQAAVRMQTLLEAMRETNLPCVISYPNADAGNHEMIRCIEAAVAENAQWQIYRNLGIEAYFSLLSHARVMVGNSSSGIIEAASLKLPVVNVGDRQLGRLHGENVIDTPCEKLAIVKAVARACGEGFRTRVAAMANPYGDGHASGRIAAYLSEMDLDQPLLMRPFHDL